MADEDLDDLIEEKPAGIKKLAIYAAIGVLVIVGGVGGSMYLMGGFPPELSMDGASDAAEQQAAVKKEAHYFSLDPAFVVNFQGGSKRSRYLKVELDAVTHDEDVLLVVRKHMPLIRNNLVLLFSNQTYDEMLSHEGKEKLRAETLIEIQKVLEKESGGKGVDEVYFTSFVMQ